MSEQFTNKATTTLNGAINNSVTSIVVTSATGFPTTGEFRIVVTPGAGTEEIMTVTAVSGTTWTVTRASEVIGGDQTARSHSNGAAVKHVLTVGALKTLSLPTGPTGAKAVRTTTLSPTNDNTYRVITFDSEDFDTNGFHDTSSNSERMTIPAGMGGPYLVLLTVKQASDSAGTYITAAVRKGGSTFFGGSKASSSHDGNGYKIAEVSTIIELAGGEYLDAGYITNSTSALGDTSDTAGNTRISFAIYKLDSGKVGTGIGASIYQSAAQTVSAGVEYTAGASGTGNFDTEVIDTSGFHDSTNPERFTIPAGLGGVYIVRGHIYHGGTPGSSYAYIRKGGSTTIPGSEDDSASSPHSLSPITITYLSAGEYVDMRGFRTSGTTSGNAGGGAANSLEIWRLDSNSSGVLASGTGTVSTFVTVVSNATPQLVTGAQVTLVTGARRCHISFNGSAVAGYNSTGGFHEIYLYIDGVNPISGSSYVLIKPGNQYWNGSFSFDTGVLTAGSHTFEVRQASNSGTGTHGIQQGAQLSVHELPDSGALVSNGIAREWDKAAITTQQSTSSTSYTDLTTSGPAVTITVPSSGSVRLSYSAEVENDSVNRAYIGFAISGATTTAASDTTAAVMRNSAGDPITIGRSLIIEGLTPGSTTFTMKYRVAGGTGTYLNREINVEILN